MRSSCSGIFGVMGRNLNVAFGSTPELCEVKQVHKSLSTEAKRHTKTRRCTEAERGLIKNSKLPLLFTSVTGNRR